MEVGSTIEAPNARGADWTTEDDAELCSVRVGMVATGEMAGVPQVARLDGGSNGTGEAAVGVNEWRAALGGVRPARAAREDGHLNPIPRDKDYPDLAFGALVASTARCAPIDSWCAWSSG
jgi:hypothetical protein